MTTAPTKDAVARQITRRQLAKTMGEDAPPFDPITAEEESIVRVTGTSKSHGVVVHGHTINAGPFEVLCYTSHARAFDALCERFQSEAHASADTARAAVDGEFAQRQQEGKGLATFEASFRAVMRRDMLPFRDVKIHAQQPEQAQQQKR